MTNTDDDRQKDILRVPNEQISPLSTRFLVAHSSPVHESTTEIVARVQDESFQSSSSNSKSSSSTTSRSSRLQLLLMQHHHSAVNSPLMYSRCTSLASLSSYDIRSSCNDSYTSECSSVKPSGLISPSDIPDSPPCEPEILEEEQQLTKPINRTLTMNTTSSHNRTTMMSETVIEKTFVYHQQFPSKPPTNINFNDADDDEHLDEVIVYSYETTEMNRNPIHRTSYDNELIFDDDSYRIFNSQTDENDLFIDEHERSINILSNPPIQEHLSSITEESSFIDEVNSNDDTNSIRILYDLIKKPHWTKKSVHSNPTMFQHSLEEIASISSNPSSLSLDSISGTSTDDEDEYDQEKGRQLIQRLIEETLARRSLPTDFLHSTSCTFSPTNTPITSAMRSASGSSSSSISASTKSCVCTTKKPVQNNSQSQRSQSSPARPSRNILDESKRTIQRQKETTIPQTRSSFLRLRQAQQNKQFSHQDKRF